MWNQGAGRAQGWGAGGAQGWGVCLGVRAGGPPWCQGWGAASAWSRVVLQEPCALGPQPVASLCGRAGTWPLPLAVTKLACASFEGSVDLLPQCPQLAPLPCHPPRRDCPAEK